MEIIGERRVRARESFCIVIFCKMLRCTEARDLAGTLYWLAKTVKRISRFRENTQTYMYIESGIYETNTTWREVV